MKQNQKKSKRSRKKLEYLQSKIEAIKKKYMAESEWAWQLEQDRREQEEKN